jgi:integrase
MARRKRSKRSNGEGTITLRDDGRWAGAISLGTDDGKRRRRWVYGKTQTEVADKLLALRTQQKNNGRPDYDNQTTGEFLTYWLEHIVRGTRRPSTYSTYITHVRKHFIPAFGDVPLRSLAPEHVQDWVTAEIKGGIKASTTRVMLIVLRAALNQAVEWQRIPRNVAVVVKSPRPEKSQVTILTPEQARQLLDAAKGNRLEAVYRVALSIGLRMGEALGLRWKDVDLDARRLEVTSALQSTTFGLILGEPKTRTSYRTIELPGKLVSALREHHMRQQQERYVAGLDWQENDLVFCRIDGRPMHSATVLSSFKRLLKRAGLPPMRFHGLRHSCVSLLAAQGLSQRQAMELLGHASIHQTMNVYTHVYDERKRDAADLMDQLLDDVI